MTSSTLDIVDVLGELFQGQEGSGFCSLSDSGPYVDRTTAALRRTLAKMAEGAGRRQAELAALVTDLGGMPRLPRVRREDQYLAYLSLACLLPILVEDKKRSIARYTDALSSIGPDNPAVADLLRRHLAEHQRDLELLSSRPA